MAKKSDAKPAAKFPTYPAQHREVPTAEIVRSSNARYLTPSEIQLHRINAQTVFTKEAAYHLRELICEHPLAGDQQAQLLDVWQHAYDALDTFQQLVKRLA